MTDSKLMTREPKFKLGDLVFDFSWRRECSVASGMVVEIKGVFKNAEDPTDICYKIAHCYNATSYISADKLESLWAEENPKFKLGEFVIFSNLNQKHRIHRIFYRKINDENLNPQLKYFYSLEGICSKDFYERDIPEEALKPCT